MNKGQSNGLNLTSVLFVIFLVLKLTGNIDWSWWWVTAPVWIPIGLGISLFLLILFIILLAVLFGTPINDIKSKIEYFKEKLN